MKKLILFIVMAFGFVAYMAAQTGTAVSHVMARDAYYWEYTPTAKQYIGGATTATDAGFDTLYFEIAANKSMPVNCNVRVEVTRAGTTDSYDIDLQAKLFANSSYAAIVESATNTASKELADTIRYQMNPNTAKAYRYYRVIVNDDNACAATDSLKITKVIFRLLERR